MNMLINQLLPNNMPCLLYYMCVEQVIINHPQQQISPSSSPPYN